MDETSATWSEIDMLKMLLKMGNVSKNAWFKALVFLVRLPMIAMFEGKLLHFHTQIQR